VEARLRLAQGKLAATTSDQPDEIRSSELVRRIYLGGALDVP
jgi:hypothetical protein